MTMTLAPLKRRRKRRRRRRKAVARPVASAPVSYTPRPYSATAVPSAYELHVLKRLGTGYHQASLQAVRRAGGIGPWLEAQLTWQRVGESPMVATVDSWFPALRRTPAEKMATHVAKTYTSWTYGQDLANRAILRRIYSTRQVRETMTDFWANHLHIAVGDDRAFVHHAAYEEVLRAGALGRFDDLLVATATHPAMSLYLDNWRSRRGAPNENQGRELLELHTVGAASGYTEDMVKASARLLSGYTVRTTSDWSGYYNAADHTTGPVTVLDFSHANDQADGRAVAEAYLRHLAHHEATAQLLARRLAVRFVSDSPSQALVDHVAAAFTASGTDIAATLRALVAHPEFRASVGQKVTTPVDDLVATARALGVSVRRPTSTTLSFAHLVNTFHGGLRLYSWPRPDGAPETTPEWTSAVRMVRSWRMHWSFAGAFYPTRDVVYVPGAARVPAGGIHFDHFVDHLCRSLLGRGSTTRILRAACIAAGVTPRTWITRTHPVAGYLFPHVAAVVLDTPEHMSR